MSTPVVREVAGEGESGDPVLARGLGAAVLEVPREADAVDDGHLFGAGEVGQEELGAAAQVQPPIGGDAAVGGLAEELEFGVIKTLVGAGRGGQLAAVPKVGGEVVLFIAGDVVPDQEGLVADQGGVEVGVLGGGAERMGGGTEQEGEQEAFHSWWGLKVVNIVTRW